MRLNYAIDLSSRGQGVPVVKRGRLTRDRMTAHAISVPAPRKPKNAAAATPISMAA